MAQERLNRRPTEGGYARGDETRQRILDVALTAFGENGYEGASTRAIAAQANLNIAALQYYFGGKSGLYRACAEHLVSKAWEGLEEAIAVLDGAGLHDSPTQLVDRLCAFLDQQALFLYSDGDTKNWVLFLAREQTNTEPSEAFDLIFDRLIQPVHLKGAELLGRILGKPADHPETKLRMTMLTSQLLALRVSSETTCRLMGWQDIREQRLDFWRSMLRAHVEASVLAVPAAHRIL